MATKKSNPKKQPAKKPVRQLIEVGTPNDPSYKHKVEAEPYDAMKKILLALLPKSPPGLTQTEMVNACAAKAPKTLFPTPGKVQWWVKCVQLDLESKGEIARDGGKPQRWSRA